MNYYEVLSEYLKTKDMITQWCYEILEKCVKYDITKVKINASCLGFGKKIFGGNITIKIDPSGYFGELLDCFIAVYPGGEKIKLSQLNISPDKIDSIDKEVTKIQWEKEKDPYILHEDFDRGKLHFIQEDIVITDPCYLYRETQYTDLRYPDYRDYKCIGVEEIKKGNTPTLSRILESYRENKRYKEDYERYNSELKNQNDSFKSLEDLGIKTYILNSTLHGDCGCYIYNTNTEESIGELCSDSGKVGVFLLSEILSYTSDFKDWVKDHPWCATIIPNFTGDVWMEIKEDNSGSFREFMVDIFGEGSINFKTSL